MNRLQFLQTKKLFKELEYIESDFEYRNEIISEADSEFISQVNNFLEHHPELKEIYDEKIDNHIQQSILRNTEEVIELFNENEVIEEEILVYENTRTSKVKKLYREIVKLTHPDKVNNKSLNDLYLSATKYYDNNDQIGIYKICTELDIDYELDEQDNQIIESKIDDLKRRIEFLESTFTWQWINTNGDKEKTEMLINYIRIRLK
jgi:hypothetical protein